jgi:hypothetical protein
MAANEPTESQTGNGLETLNSQDWDALLRRIKAQKCTPILGPGAYLDSFSLSLKVAQDWAAADPEYPFENCFEISRVAQFLSIKFDVTDPKDRIVDHIRQLTPPDFDNAKEPHRILASLPLPVYITTNYDDFMKQALELEHKDPKRDFSRWNKFCQDSEPSIFASDYRPTVANPTVFHLHGHAEVAESLVLTDDDYLDFLVSISKDEKLIPHHIEKALTGTSLMLMGYRLDDWNFRVLFRSIVSYLEKSLIKTHVCVQLEPADTSIEQRTRARKYFNRYFDRHDVRVYWGTCQDFAVELKKRWKESGHDG